ncbi:helix-turn-helix domain-containing protein [Faucicola boevrei]|uniref:helix-turn-helix domain-containing protein n=1 Tax=Faucicola boevrei TaxID=346665 RepID=UPI00037E0C9C|nr:helix-turn-helix transcriptional regulator [Moraxella boevrei]
MNTYHFTIIVRDATAFDDSLDDLLFEAGCDDALVCRLDNVIYLEFDRIADTAKDAVKSAFANLNQAGFYDLILQEKGVSSLAEMAKRLDVSRATMSHYANNKRGCGNFPKPVAGVLSGSALYDWGEVAEWLYRQGKLSQNDYDVATVSLA